MKGKFELTKEERLELAIVVLKAKDAELAFNQSRANLIAAQSAAQGIAERIVKEKKIPNPETAILNFEEGFIEYDEDMPKPVITLASISPPSIEKFMSKRQLKLRKKEKDNESKAIN